jgi:hypothetical protein
MLTCERVRTGSSASEDASLLAFSNRSRNTDERRTHGWL